jgi:hypothetical protein
MQAAIDLLSEPFWDPLSGEMSESLDELSISENSESAVAARSLDLKGSCRVGTRLACASVSRQMVWVRGKSTRSDLQPGCKLGFLRKPGYNKRLTSNFPRVPFQHTIFAESRKP